MSFLRNLLKINFTSGINTRFSRRGWSALLGGASLGAVLLTATPGVRATSYWSASAWGFTTHDTYCSPQHDWNYRTSSAAFAANRSSLLNAHYDYEAGSAKTNVGYSGTGVGQTSSNWLLTRVWGYKTGTSAQSYMRSNLLGRGTNGYSISSIRHNG